MSVIESEKVVDSCSSARSASDVEVSEFPSHVDHSRSGRVIHSGPLIQNDPFVILVASVPLVIKSTEFISVGQYLQF